MTLWPLAAYIGFVVFLVVAVVALSYVLGERHNDRATGEPYESGIVSTGSARVRLSTKFYLVALLFVLFDLEAVFIFAWAIAVPELGWAGYYGLLVFVGLLVVGLVYEWRQGALDWGRSLKATQRARAARLSSQGLSSRGDLSSKG
jgi:NADH-quinone oxidoreductase subunit A